MSEANKEQVGGTHYKSNIEHWDYVAENDLDYFQGQITRYVSRWKKKDGLKDLEKGLHVYMKYIELVKQGKYKPDVPMTYVNKELYGKHVDQPEPFGYKPELEHD